MELEDLKSGQPKIAIIGGSGFHNPGVFKKEMEIQIQTPFGYPSAPIEIGDFMGKKVAFIARHGKSHQFPPHKVPHRANIWALKKLGVERIIGICTVGSLQETFRPGELVLCDQFIDFTKKREYTFYDKKAVHVSLADPFCQDMRMVFADNAKKLNIPIHQTGVYFCIEGPRFSTRAESRFLKSYADVVGMTLNPEAALARELEICYVSIAMVTDYDVWQESPVSAQEVKLVMENNMEKVRQLLVSTIPYISEQRSCSCKDALKFSEI